MVSTNTSTAPPQPDKWELQKIECRNKGGKWDEASKTCVFPDTIPGLTGVPLKTDVFGEEIAKRKEQEKAAKQAEEKAKQTQPEVFTDEKTGKLSGVTLPDGRTFMGLNPEDVRKISKKNIEDTTPPEGTQFVGTAQNMMERQQRLQQLQAMAQQGLITPQELQAIQGASPDIPQVLGAGAAAAIPGIIGGAVTGAVGGAAVGGIGAIPGAVGGAVIGGIGAFLVGIKGNIKQQQAEEFAADREALVKGQRYLRSLITDTNQNPQNAADNMILFYQTLNMIDAAHAKTYKDSQENLNKFLGNDGTVELQRFTVFDATMRQYYVSQFQSALAAPNPNAVLITQEDLQAENE